MMSHKGLFDREKDDIGVMPGIYYYIPTSDTTPIITRQWRPQMAKQHIKEERQKMLNSTVIEPSTSSIVLVWKKDNSFWFCIDFRNLNAHTTADFYPLPQMEKIIDELRQNVICSILGARSAYWSIELNPDGRPNMAFSDGTNMWQFWRMPYGLKTAGATCQRMSNFILSPVLGRHTMAYLDDAVIYSMTT